MPDPLATIRRDIGHLRGWSHVALDVMDAMIDRVTNPSDFAPDLQARLDRDAVEHMRMCMRDGERILDRASQLESEVAAVLEEEIDLATANARGRLDETEALLRYICQDPEQQAHVREELSAVDIDVRSLSPREVALVTAVARGICSAFLEEEAAR